MKNLAVNTLGYAGTVTLSQYTNGKKTKLQVIQNSGGNPLFNFLADCLAGDFAIAEFSRPTKIKLLYAERDNEKDKTPPTPDKLRSVSRFIYMLSEPERIESTKGSSVNYSFIVPGDMLESVNFNSLGLYSDNENDFQNYAAFCYIDTEQTTISASAILVVDWELNISNK